MTCNGCGKCDCGATKPQELDKVVFQLVKEHHSDLQKTEVEQHSQSTDSTE